MCVCVFILPGTDGFIIIIIARWMDTIPGAVRVRTGSAYIYSAAFVPGGIISVNGLGGTV